MSTYFWQIKFLVNGFPQNESLNNLHFLFEGSFCWQSDALSTTYLLTYISQSSLHFSEECTGSYLPSYGPFPEGSYCPLIVLVKIEFQSVPVQV